MMVNFFNYSRGCQKNRLRQPVVLSEKEYQYIKTHYPSSIGQEIKYGSGEDKQNYYICPQYWCLVENRPLSAQEVKDGACGGKIIPKKAKVVPKGKYIFEFNDGGIEHVDQSTGEYIRHYPGFLKNRNTKGHCVPCCFKKWDSKSQISKRKDCIEGIKNC